MALSNKDKKLLGEILKASLKSPNGLNAARFRADNAQSIPELDQLERLGYVRRKNDLYSITPLALVYLPKEDPDAQSLVQKCGLVFALLQGNYRDSLGEEINVPNIAGNTGLSEDDVRAALRIIIQTPILGSHSSDLTSKDAYIAPSENILKYNSFEHLLRQMQEWAKERDNRSHESIKIDMPSPEYPLEQIIPLSESRANWMAIRMNTALQKGALAGESILLKTLSKEQQYTVTLSKHLSLKGQDFQSQL